MKFLVIDDDPKILELIEVLLREEGHEVYTAENGKVGVSMYQSIGDISCVITDIIMPEKEGIETIHDLKAMDKNLKIIAISGGRKAAAEYLDTASLLGASAVLRKPFANDRLLDVIKEVMAA